MADRFRYETERLVVSDWGAARHDLVEIVREVLTPAVTEPLPPEWHGSYNAARAARWIRERNAEGRVLLATSRDSDRVIGLVVLHDSASGDGEPTPSNEGLAGEPTGELRVGYLIAEPHWGQGYATELVEGLVGWAAEVEYRRIVAGVDRDNAPSRRVLEKCGFVLQDPEPPAHEVPGHGGTGGPLYYAVEITRGLS